MHTVGSTRLTYYHDASLDKHADLLTHVSDKGFYYKKIDELKDLRLNTETITWEILVSW
jgi:hypothetical protein